MDIKAKIGTRIKQIRQDLNLTQESIAFKAEVDRTFMNHVENGKRNVSIETLEKVIKALETSFKDFFDSEIFSDGKKKRS